MISIFNGRSRSLGEGERKEVYLKVHVGFRRHLHLFRGAMLAVELVEPGTKNPDPALTARISAACHKEGLITLSAGTFGNVLRFLPPLVIGADLLDEGLGILETAIRASA